MRAGTMLEPAAELWVWRHPRAQGAAGRCIGRTDDMLKVKGVVVYPATFESVIRSLPEVGDEFEVVIARDGEMDDVRVRVEPAPNAGIDAATLAERVAAAIGAQVGIRVRCEALAPGTLERPQMKARRVHDRRQEHAAP